MSNETISVVVATIAEGESLSGAVFTGGLIPCAVQMPAAWDAADMSFQAACDVAGVFGDVYKDDGTELTVSVDADLFVSLDPTRLLGVTFIKIRSGTSASAVNQTAERKIKLALKLN